MKEKILIVDGYNMIAFWQSTKQSFRQGRLDEARSILLDKLSNYASFEQIQVICVFDAQHVPGLRQRYDAYNVSVIFTQEEETADIVGIITLAQAWNMLGIKNTDNPNLFKGGVVGQLIQ